MPESVTMAGLTPEPTPLRPGCPLCRRHRSSRNRFWGPVRGPSVPCRALWAEMLRMGREEKQEEKKTDPAWEGAEPKKKIQKKKKTHWHHRHQESQPQHRSPGGRGRAAKAPPAAVGSTGDPALCVTSSSVPTGQGGIIIKKKNQPRPEPASGRSVFNCSYSPGSLAHRPGARPLMFKSLRGGLCKTFTALSS